MDFAGNELKLAMEYEQYEFQICKFHFDYFGQICINLKFAKENVCQVRQENLSGRQKHSKKIQKEENLTQSDNLFAKLANLVLSLAQLSPRFL